MTAQRYDAIVIGAGVNGLVAAATLARAGKRVLVVERAETIGGQAAPIEVTPGFRAPLGFDTGWVPPAVLRELAVAAPPIAEPIRSISVASGDGGFLSLPCDLATADDVIRKYSANDARRWPALADRLGKLAEFLGTLYQLPAPDVGTTSIGDLASLVGVGRKFRALGKEDMTELLRVMPMSIQDLLDDALESDTLKAAIGAGGVRDLRQGPRSGGTTFNLLHYLIGAPRGSARARGWWRDGSDAFATVVGAAARAIGVTIRTGAPVERIVVDDDAVTGVVLSGGEEIGANVVVSTADPSATLLGLVDPLWLDPDTLLALQNIKYRGSTAIVMFALDRLPEGLDGDALASVVSLTPHLDGIERAYDAAKYGDVSDSPHVELSVPSLRWPALAPQGKHVLVAHVRYVPRNPVSGAWTSARSDALGDTVTRAIASAMPGFGDLVLHRSVLTPADLEERFGLTDGALTHGELTLDQILFMRPLAGWRSGATPVHGLYLGGAGSHPGPGILGAAGWLAARAAIASRNPRRA